MKIKNLRVPNAWLNPQPKSQINFSFQFEQWQLMNCLCAHINVMANYWLYILDIVNNVYWVACNQLMTPVCLKINWSRLLQITSELNSLDNFSSKIIIINNYEVVMKNSFLFVHRVNNVSFWSNKQFINETWEEFTIGLRLMQPAGESKVICI